MSSDTRTLCPYCGVGCGLIATVSDGRLAEVRGDPIYPVNRGRVCPKPLALPAASRSPDRATVPLRRASRDERWRETGWDEAVPWLAGRLREIKERHGPDAIAFYISGQLLTEDYYAVNKLAKGALGTNNVDSNSRLCMSSAVAGYKGSFGSDGPPPAYADIALADCFLLLGSNAAACHPILWTRIRDRQAEGATVIVVDPRRTDTAAAADLHLPVRPGTDLALLNALLHVIEPDRDFIRRHTEGWDEVARVAAEWPPERAAEVCGVPAAGIERAARLFARAPRAMALWSMGANQSTVGTLKNQALNNLCLATGNLGRPGTGPLSLTGQPNAMGGRETGGLAQLLPGYRSVENAADREQIEALWGMPVSPRAGLPATDLFDALEDGRVRAVWICATNPVVSMPDAERARAALRRAELVVCQDAYHPTETSALAHLVLPAAQWPEKEGTMTNSERRVGLVRRALDPPGEALPDWQIFARVARALGLDGFAWESAAEVYDEFAACTAGRLCDVSGLSHERLRRVGSVQWPCPASPLEDDEHPGTERLYEDAPFPTPSGRARLVPTPHAEPAEAPSAEFPLVLTTGRVAGQWHTMTRTGKSRELLAADPEPFVELNAADAPRGAEHVRLVSARGSAVFRVRVTERVPPGTAFAPFHWGALHAPPGVGALNELTHRAADPVSFQPELKACAVRVERVRSAECGVRSAEVVVVGTGMAAVAVVESALLHDPSLRVTMVGREPELPYNRVRLSAALFSGRELALHPPAWYAERGVRLVTGVEAERLDLGRRVVETSAGELGYDRLVLATGSAPALPPIAGIEHAHAFRTLADARAIASSAAGARRAVVIGGGLLGLEAARGLAGRGLAVTVVHLVERVMETQLDGAAAGLVARELRRLGVEVLLGRVTEEIGEGGVRLGSGEQLEADLVVVATGIRPDVELARGAGLEVGRGVLADDELRTSTPNVWAVGECAEHRGTVYGLWAPLLAQARAAGASVAGRPGAFHGSVPATTLKVSGIDLFAGGRHSAEDDDEHELVAMDTRARLYRKLVLRGDRLSGVTLLGDISASPELAELLRSGDAVPDELLAVSGPSGIAEPEDDNALVCSCNGVSRGRILAVARDRGLERVEQVSDATGASTGCGSCAPRVRALLDGLREERVAQS